MKQTPFCLLFILLFQLNLLHAQQSSTTSGVDTIKYYKGRERFYLNDKKLTIAELKPILNTFNPSAIEFKRYQKKATPGTLILLTGITAGVLSFTKLNKETHFFTPYTITLTLGDLIGIPLMISANKHLRKSVALYNKEISKKR
jgi:hypothetical protein